MLGLLQQASRAGQAGLAVAANRAQTAVDLAIEGAALVSVISELGLYMVGKLVYDGQSISQVGDGAFTAVHERMQHGAEQTPP
ncbi:hypothetical protein WJX72_004178 [[Myrmecia] bisecta]|uniref:Uncharacterized protein n=1 Tax=[Myrmecia] bisecta TaxID=41462 RepID=A0AAW1QQ83_9CHLO